MNAQQVFGLQVALSFAVYGLAARWYVAPRLAPLPLGQALQPLLLLHAFRHLGMVFSGWSFWCRPSSAPRSRPASRWPPPTAICWPASWLWPRSPRSAPARASRSRSRGCFNVVGLLDLVNAFYQGLSHDVQLGAAYFIPTFIVPALVVTHVMVFRMLLRHPG